MTYVTNCHKSPLAISGGAVVLQPGKPTRVPNWSEHSGHRTVKLWIKAGLLHVDEPAAPEPLAPVAVPIDEKGELIARLATLGVKKNRRSSVESLRAELAKAGG